MSTIPPLFQDILAPAPLATIYFVETMATLLEQTPALAGVCHEASQSEDPTWRDIGHARGILEAYTASSQAFFARWQAERYPGSHIHECAHCGPQGPD